MPDRGRSKRKVLLAITIAQQAYSRGIVRFAREHDWHLVTDMTYTGRVPLGWRGDGILTVLGYRRELSGQRIDVLLNFSSGLREVSLPQPRSVLLSSRLSPPLSEGLRLRLRPFESVILAHKREGVGP